MIDAVVGDGRGIDGDAVRTIHLNPLVGIVGERAERHIDRAGRVDFESLVTVVINADAGHDNKVIRIPVTEQDNTPFQFREVYR